MRVERLSPGGSAHTASVRACDSNKSDMAGSPDDTRSMPEDMERATSADDMSRMLDVQLQQDMARMSGSLPSATQRFTVGQDLFQNPKLSQAAWDEIQRQDSIGLESVTMSRSSPRHTDKSVGELQRQKDAVVAIEHESREESRLNQGMARLAMSRLEATKKSLDTLQYLLQTLASAERAYATALCGLPAISLPCDSDPPHLTALHTAAAHYPSFVGTYHQQQAVKIAACCDQVATTGASLHSARTVLNGSMQMVQQSMDHHLDMLHSALTKHEAACMELDHLADQKRKSRLTWAPKQDPWNTEAGLLAAHTSMLRSQQSERHLVASAYRHVERLEGERIECITASVTTLLKEYSENRNDAHVAAAKVLLERIAKVDTISHVKPLTDAAASAEVAQTHMQRQNDEAQLVLAHDLFSSPEIVRQGSMEHWNSGSGSWDSCHAVLTRSGFLHLCLTTTAKDAVPTTTLKLARCQFDGGSSTVFNLTQSNAARVVFFAVRSEKHTFRSSSVEECCDWTVSIREMIGSWNGKGTQAVRL